MRILIAEDDRVLADGITRSLRQAGFAVDWVGTGSGADVALQRDEYNLLVLDLGLPGMDGFEVLRRLRRAGGTLPVLILTARDGVEDRVAGLDLGADDYMVKPFALPELEARVRALMRRGMGAASSDLVFGPLQLDFSGRRALLNGVTLDLSAREWGVLEILALRMGRIVSKEHILQALCGWDEEISLNAVEVYVYRLRTKLDPAGLVIRTVRGLGYMMEKPAA
ncbi:MAG: response regulator [Burkholderiales bacterium]